MEEYADICDLPLERMKKISSYIQEQMDKGLKGEKSDLKMLVSFVDDVCKGVLSGSAVISRKRAGIRNGARYGGKQRESHSL